MLEVGGKLTGVDSLVTKLELLGRWLCPGGF